jgi:hypothetical protein
MTHEMLWSIFDRMLNTLKGEKLKLTIALALKKNDFSKFSRERNRLIYECASWSREEDIGTSDLHQPVKYMNNLRYFETDGSTLAEYYSKYYIAAQAILNMVDLFLSELGRFAPAVGAHLNRFPSAGEAKTLVFA